MIYILGIITGLVIAVLVAVLHSMFKVSVPREINKIANEIKKTIPSQRGSFLDTEIPAEKLRKIFNE